MSLTVIILAAGQGKRMKSSCPKVLHKLAHQSMLEHVVMAAQGLHPRKIIVVYGYQGDMLRACLDHLEVTWVEQKEPLGTGHAVKQALSEIQDKDRVLVLCGDVPLISTATLHRLISSTPDHAIGLITAEIADPGALGRIVRDDRGRFSHIIEYQDATEEERALKEINGGLYVFDGDWLRSHLDRITPNNQQKEYYLTDLLAMAVEENLFVNTLAPARLEEIMGVNDRRQLASLERIYQSHQVENLMRQGVLLRDPARVDIRGEVIAEEDVSVDVNVIFEGKVFLKRNCHIGAHSIIRDSILEEGVIVEPYSLIEGAHLEKQAHVGPFARLRPGSLLKKNAKVGNFVEVKKSTLGENSKVSHLSYIGDALVGDRVNLGAGTITCNYDGKDKYQTIIHDDVFVGSGTELVAPVEIGEGAFIGAGSTITQAVPAHELTLARARQQTIVGWKKNREKT